MDIKSSFYLSFPIKNSEHNKRVETSTIFKTDNANIKIQTNSAAEKVLTLANSVKFAGLNYNYLCGWESAKTILSKICLDCNYVLRILIVGQTEQFILGFQAYQKNHEVYSKFEIEYHAYVSHGDKISKSIASLQKKWNYHALLDNREITDIKYDGIISCYFTHSYLLHPKGFYLNIVPRNNFEIFVMYSAFIWKTSVLIDVPILSELFVLNNAIIRASRENWHIISFIPIRPSSRTATPEKYDEIFNELELKAISNRIKARQNQLDKIDYASLWFELNPNFGTTIQSEVDLLDLSSLNIGDLLLKWDETKTVYEKNDNDEYKS